MRENGWLVPPMPAGGGTAPGHVTQGKRQDGISRVGGPVCRKIGCRNGQIMTVLLPVFDQQMRLLWVWRGPASLVFN